MKLLQNHVFAGIIFVAIAGTLGHFLYEWSGDNFIVGLFFAKNESTFEHMKLLYYPMLLYSIFLSIRFRKIHPCISAASISGTLLGTFLIPVFFYTYSGVLGFFIDILNILVFYAAVICGFLWLFQKTLAPTRRCSMIAPWIVAGITTALFLLLTVYPIPIGLFKA